MREHDISDGLLDEALKSYADPSDGFEQRVLARLDEFRTITAVPARRPAWLWFAIASPVAACVLFAVLVLSGVLPGRHQTTSRAPEIARSDSSTASVPAPDVTSHPLRAPSRRTKPHTFPREVASAGARRALPKLDVFPTVPSLTPEERALLEWQKHAPESARHALVQPAPVPPHDIADLHIKPIETPELGSE